jgi:hypothetical protein
MEPDEDNHPLGLDAVFVPVPDAVFDPASLVSASCNFVSSSVSLVSSVGLSARPHEAQYRLRSGMDDWQKGQSTGRF